MEPTVSRPVALRPAAATNLPLPVKEFQKDSVKKVAVPTKRSNAFAELGVMEELCRAVHDSGYDTPTPIQLDAIPDLLNGRDVFGSADTGTGKTAAFMLPALQKLSVKSEKPGKGPRVLVLTPTRELAAQITQAAKKYSTFLPRIKTVSILGGMPYEPQRRDLKHFVDILVATPGRLLDHTREGRIDYSRVEMFVLDEADRMLDMGFLDDVTLVANELPKDRQTVLFSATLHKKILSLAEKITKNPKRIEIASSEQTNDNVQQKILFANDETHKRKLLKAILEGSDVSQAIVFSATKAHTETIADELEDAGISAAAIHGDLRQRSREAVLRKLRTNKFRVLVATDVASRGIDIPGLSHVINFDIPRTAEDYTHRIGRTGRAGCTGTAITLVMNSERHKLRFIEKDLGHQVSVEVIAGLEPKPVAPGSDRGGRGGSSSRRRFGGNSGGGSRGGYSEGRAAAGNSESRGPRRDTRGGGQGQSAGQNQSGGRSQGQGQGGGYRGRDGGAGSGNSTQGNGNGRRDSNGGGYRGPSGRSGGGSRGPSRGR